MNMKETFDNIKVGNYYMIKLQNFMKIAWFKLQRWMPDTKHNKAKWISCKVASYIYI